MPWSTCRRLILRPFTGFMTLTLIISWRKGFWWRVCRLAGGWELCPVPCLLGSSAEGTRFCYIVRNCLLIVNALAILSIFLLYVQNFSFFVFARMFQGFCTGLLSSIAPLMMKELAPTEISGTLTSCHQIFITCGATFGFVFSLMLSFIMNDTTGEKKWWIVFGFSLIILVAQSWLLVFKFNFETPKYLLLNNREEEARELV